MRVFYVFIIALALAVFGHWTGHFDIFLIGIICGMAVMMIEEVFQPGRGRRR